jgi:hypothetical protein
MPSATQDATVAVRAPSLNFGSTPSWVSNPTVQVSSQVAGALLAGLAPAAVAQQAPAALSGLFDGISGTNHDAQPAAVPAAATDDDGLNFTLEPGATLEPDPALAAPETEAASARAPSSRGIAVELAQDGVSVPPPGASVGMNGGFAELDALDLDSPVADIPSAEADLVDEASFDIAEDVVAAEPPVAPAFVPPAAVPPAFVPPAVDLAAADESSFADVEFALEHDPAPALDGEAAFDALSLDGLETGDASIDVDGSLDALAELDRQISSAEGVLANSTLPAVPSLSGRVGTLAEELESEGRIADAAMLYEVQAVLAASGR